MTWYKLEGKKVVEYMRFTGKGFNVSREAEMDYHKWWADFKNRRVRSHNLFGLHVSTVFLGIDHGFSYHDDPVVFETMILGHWSGDYYCERYTDYDAAVRGHYKALLIGLLYIPKYWIDCFWRANKKQ